MKHLIEIALITTMLFLIAFVVVGCEPENATEVITNVNEAMSDPNSSVQVTAENLQELVGTGMILVRAIPGFPYAKAILGALAIVQAVITIILGWRKHIDKTALKEVVRGNEILKKEIVKKGNVDIDDFKKAQDTAQNEPTVEIVNKIRQKVA